jgi:hypothetical protein
MPHYNITESYVETPAQLSVTDNVVLVPILITSAGEEKLSPKLYTTYNSFSSDYGLYKVSYDDGNLDRSYIFAGDLLRMGLYIVALPVVFTGTTYEDAVTAVNAELSKSDIMDLVESKNLYDIKFITTGGYPNIIPDDSKSTVTLGVCACTNMIKIAADRGDAIAMLELPEDFSNTDNEEFLNKLIGMFPNQVANGQFAECTYPSINMNLINYNDYNQSTSWMPGTFGKLLAFANMLTTAQPWYAPAGVTRGVIPNLIETKYKVTDAQKNILQYTSTDGEEQKLFICINPIMEIHGYGTIIFGNRTFAAPLKADGLSYKNILSIRYMLSIIKKQIYSTMVRLTFEPNDDIVWLSFKNYNNTILDKMKSGRGISSYYWKKQKAEEKATLKAMLTIVPIEPVESFDITIKMTDDTTSVAEE